MLTPLPTAAPVVVNIGISLPMSMQYINDTDAVRNGVLLAVRAADPIPGVTIRTILLDDTSADRESSKVAASNMTAFAGNPSVVGVVGPDASAVARVQIPISNQAGLLQCSPSAQSADLTLVPGADKLRPKGFGANNFFRLHAPDIDLGLALAKYAHDTLHQTRAVVVSDGSPYGVATAQRFTDGWGALANTRVVGTFTADASLNARMARVAELIPDVVFFAAHDTEGPYRAAALRIAMNKAGLQTQPLLVSELVPSAESTPKVPHLHLDARTTGPVYQAVDLQWNVPGYKDFASLYRSVNGEDPTGWSFEAYVCTQVIVAAIRTAAASGAITRGAVLQAATTPGFHVDTIFGRLSFTRMGDAIPSEIAIFSTDATTNESTFLRQVEIDTP